MIPRLFPQDNAKAVKKAGRGWILVNYSAENTRNLKKLAMIFGYQFRAVCESALRRHENEMRKQLGLSRHQLGLLTDKQAKALAGKARAIRALEKTYAPVNN